VLFPAMLEKYVTADVPEHGSFHELSRWTQAFYGIELPCSGTCIKRRYSEARVSFTDCLEGEAICLCPHDGRELIDHYLLLSCHSKRFVI
jgi:hypothetical protein